jgi:hypothetical protein
VESVLVQLAQRDTAADVCHGCVLILAKRFKDMQDNLWSQGTPGQELCKQMLKELSGLIQRFPDETDLHATCHDFEVTMCCVCGVVLGEQAPGISQEHPHAGAVVCLDRDTQRSVKAAVDIAEKADRSGSILARGDRTTLLARTQPLSDLLRTADLAETMAVLDEVKHGLSWYIDAMFQPGRKEYEYAKTFLQHVKNNHQQEHVFTEITEKWVQRAETSGNYNNYDDDEMSGNYKAITRSTLKTRERFTLVGLLFDLSTHILAPLPQRKDTRMIKTSLNAVWDLNIIQPFDWSTQVEIVHTIQKLGGKQQREVFGFSSSEYWMYCEASYVALLTPLLQGSYCRIGSSQLAFDQDVVDWVIQEACDIVDHALTCPATSSDHTWVLRPALKCLNKVFEGAHPGDAWQDAVGNAARRALQYSLSFDSKSAQESEEEASELRRMCRCGPCQ